MMSRDIEFRGKVKEGKHKGKWVYGSLVIDRNTGQYFIYQFNYSPNVGAFEVNPGTVGQFTGLILKKCKKVFEHDIVENNGCHGYPNWKPKQVVWGNTLDKALSTCCGFMLDGTQMFLSTNDENMTLIGNIHDNPELLK